MWEVQASQGVCAIPISKASKKTVVVFRGGCFKKGGLASHPLDGCWLCLEAW